MRGYCFAIARLPDPLWHPFKAKRALEFLNSLPGLKAIHPTYEVGAILIFERLNDAKVSRNRIVAEGNDAGPIMRVDASDDWQVITIKLPEGDI